MYKLLPVTTQTEFCRLYYKYILTCKYLPLWNKRIVLYFQDKKRYQFVNSNWHLAKKFSKYRFWEMKCSTNLTLWQAHNYTLLSRTVWWNHVQRSKLCYAANLMAMKFKYMCATIKIPLKFSIWQLCLPKEAFHRSWKYFCVVCSVQYGKILFSRDYAN